HPARWRFRFFLFFFLFVIFVERVVEAAGIAKLVRFIVTQVEGFLEIHLSSSILPDAAAPVCADLARENLKRQNLRRRRIITNCEHHRNLFQMQFTFPTKNYCAGMTSTMPGRNTAT